MSQEQLFCRGGSCASLTGGVISFPRWTRPTFQGFLGRWQAPNDLLFLQNDIAGIDNEIVKSHDSRTGPPLGFLTGGLQFKA